MSRKLPRIIGWTLMAVWLLAAAAIIRQIAGDFESFERYFLKLLGGLGVTLRLILLSLFFGALLSLPIVFARMSASRALNAVGGAYVYFFRGTPLIAQVFLIYYGAGAFRGALTDLHLWWLFRDSFSCGVLAFALNTAAYQAEILRGALRNVPRGQMEGAYAVGLPKSVAFFYVTLPQALILALRPYSNEIILLIKGSAIVAIITVFDIMGETRRLFSRTFDYNVYILAALFYLALVEIIRFVWEKIEIRLTRHLHR